ncbi:DUF2075 domain-containing protein [Companilactobacillus formosensis]|uniref:DUF2075 domain-containing protein n=1 Tax=Companilactobacillus formosensis TaxID=1617889 RepID=UPI000E646256|nr:DUF2075 domain-containing protein [Companilactobacillus formosensis]
MLESVFPNKELTQEQQAVFNQIMEFSQNNLQSGKKGVFQLNGDAGTGKSVILTKLFLEMEKRHQTNNYFLVNHPELLKVYQANAGQFKELRKNRFLRPTSFINTMHKKQQTADIVIIDEAHLLLSESDNYNNFHQKNQLEEIIKLSKIVILVYDQRQVLKLKSYWSQSLLDRIVSEQKVQFASATLKTQMRMQAPERVVNWIDNLTINNKLLPLKNHDDYLTMNTEYDFRVYDDAQKMYQELKKKNNELGECRIVATADYPSTLDGKKHFVNEGKFHLPWDQYNYDQTTWAQKPETINEIGSMYTVQGFDLQYVAVIIGPTVTYAGNKKIKVDAKKYEDREAFKNRHDSDLKNIDQIKRELILNSINILLKRGIKGCFVYFHDSEIFETLKNQ